MRRIGAAVIPLRAPCGPQSWDEGEPPQGAPIVNARRPKANRAAKPANGEKAAFAQRLKMARKAAGYETAAEGARALDIEVATYGRWERAETEPNLAAIKAICKTYRVSSDFLVLNRMPE